MKPNIHPTWYPQARVVCACGNTFTTGSTREEIRVEICSSCHPFFTGQMKFVDTMGKVERFQQKVRLSQEKKVKEKKKVEEAKQRSDQPLTLREMLHATRK